MVTVAKGPRIIRESLDQTIKRLERLVARYERRYECSSEEIVKALKSGSARETADVNDWLMNFRTLRKLRATRGATTGSRTKHT